MNSGDLMQLGLNRNEAEVYTSLVKYREADAHLLIKDTQFHKKIVYDNLQKLMDKGLVTFIIKEGRRVFSLAPPHMLSAYVEEQERQIEQRKELAIKLKKEIEETAKQIPEKQEATVFSGIQALKAFYAETLEAGEYYVLGAPKNSVEIMGDLFWDSYHLKRKERKQMAYLLLNSSLKKWGDSQKNNYSEIKYFKQDFEPQTEIHIQSDFVAIIVWTQEPLVFKMKNKTVVSSYKKHFDLLWKKAK